MSTSIPASANDLKNYIKAKLGSDIVRLEISDDQYEIVINDTMQLFYNYAFDGYEERYENTFFTYGTNTITLDDSILSVVEVFGNMRYMNPNIAIMTLDADMIYGNKSYSFDFSKITHKLTIFEDFNTDLDIGIRVYKKLDSSTYTDIYNHQWVKSYSVALAKQQWGQNLIKYDNVILPGEMRLNAQAILNEGKEEVKFYEEELRQKYAFFPLPQSH